MMRFYAWERVREAEREGAASEPLAGIHYSSFCWMVSVRACPMPMVVLLPTPA